MSIERAIHEHWTTWRPLASLVPDNRFYTGRAPALDARGDAVGLPYVSLELPGDLEIERTSSGTVLLQSVVRFSVYAQRLSHAEAIAEQVVARFHRADFAWNGGRVLDVKQNNRAQTEQNDGVWRIRLDFAARISR